MVRRPALLAALVLATGAAVLALRALPRTPHGAAAGPAIVAGEDDTTGAGHRLRCPPGEARTYTLALSSSQTARLLEAGQAGTLDLAATVELRCHAESPESAGGQAVGFRFVDLARHDLAVLGQSVLGDAAAARGALIGPETLATLSPRGELLALRTPASVDPLFRHLARAVLTQMQIVEDTAPDASAWTAEESTTLGRSTVDYTRLPNEAGRTDLRLEKRRTGYTRLDALPYGTAAERVETDGELIATLRDGRLVSLAGEETARAFGAGAEPVLDARTRITLTLVSVGRFDPSTSGAEALAALTPASADGPDVSPALERRLLEARVAGLTMEGLIDDVLEFADGGALPDHNRWLWRATGLLTLEPGRCAELVTMFSDPHLTPVARGLLLDLLANAGHAQAQAALRQMLDADAARADAAAAPALLQRVALLETPTAETLDWAVERMAEETGPLGEASVVTVGALVGQRARALGGARGEAEPDAANTALLQRLDDAQTAREREVAVLALGNAGLPANLPHLAHLAGDPDPTVRAAVATALRKTRTDEARGTLLGLLADRDEDVQRAAGRVLSTQTLDAESLALIAGRVLSGEIRPAAYPGVLTALSALPGDTGAQQVLRAMLHRGVDPLLAERIRGLLSA